MRRALLAVFAALTATVTMVAVAAAPAQATARAAVPVLSTGCDGFLYSDTTGAAPGANGRLHGFVGYRYSTACADQIFYFEGAGTSWTTRTTGLRGTVIDVAQDATGTYLLYAIRELSETAELAVAHRAPDGTVKRLDVLAPLDGTAFDGRGSIIVRDGKWLAVWSQASGTVGDYDLYRYGTLYPTTGTIAPVAIGSGRDTSPTLAFSPKGEVVLAFARGAQSSKVIRVARTADGSAWSWRTAASGVPFSSDFPRLDLAVTSAGTFVSWTQWLNQISDVIVADDLTGSWRRQKPPAVYDSANWDASIVASGAKVFAGYSSGDEYPSDALVFAKRTTSDGAWTEVPSTGVPGSIDSRGVVGLAAYGGSVTAVVFSGEMLYAVTGLAF